MKPNWRHVVLFLAPALILGLAYWQRAFFLVYLVEPVARILWLVYRTLLSIGQEWYWGLLVLSALILILRMLPDNPVYARRPSAAHPHRGADRVAYWRALLASAENDPYDRLALQQRLTALARSVESLASGREEEEIPSQSFSIEFPRRRLAAWMPPFLVRMLRLNQRGTTTALEKQVDRIVRSLETQLETNHDPLSDRAIDD